MVAITWTKPTSIISGEIRRREERARSALVAMCQHAGTDLANRSKSNAKWNDRTTNARSGISSEVMVAGETIEIVVYHVVDYAPYLELGTSKMPKLGVMAEETVTSASQVTADAQKIIRGLFG